MENKTAIIDADSLAYFEMGATSYENAITGIDSRIASMLDATGATHYSAYLTPSRTFRHDLTTTRPYKGNRPSAPNPPIWYALKEYVKQAHGGIEVPGFEADDMVSIHAAASAKLDEKYVVCSCDKDVLGQIAGTHWNYQKAEFVTTTPEQAERFLWLQVLAGDSTDNIEGLPGIGIKKAEAILDANPIPAKLATWNAYAARYDVLEAVERFREMFNLVFLRRELPTHLAVHLTPPRARESINLASTGFDDLTVDDFDF